MDLEFHQLDRRHEVLRRVCPQPELRLLGSLAELGQQVPIVVVALEPLEPQRYLVIDGFKRLRCLERLGSDTVRATLWDLPENDALLLDRSQRSSEGLTELEHGWLLSALLEQGLSQQELARRVAKSPSWVSRHLGLVRELPAAVQDLVRRGAIPAHAAMRQPYSDRRQLLFPVRDQPPYSATRFLKTRREPSPGPDFDDLQRRLGRVEDRWSDVWEILEG